jgi:hypothetical protein
MDPPVAYGLTCVGEKIQTMNIKNKMMAKKRPITLTIPPPPIKTGFLILSTFNADSLAWTSSSEICGISSPGMKTRGEPQNEHFLTAP